MEWLKLSIWIGTYGFLKEYRPEDPYIIQYLTQAPMNFSSEVVYQEIFPIATYVSLSLLIIVFLLTDWLRYKPVIIVHALSAVLTQVILIWCRSKRAMFLMEACYGTMTACETAYYTYIYAKVDRKHYQIVTSHMRGASLTGRFMSGLTSQIVLYYGMTIADLNYLTLIGMSLGFLWALTLPSVKSSIYFHRSSSVADFNDCTKVANGQLEITCGNDGEASERMPILRKMCFQSVVFQRLWADFKHAYTNSYVLKWSAWWALATCGYTQFMTYVQILWEEVVKDNPGTTTKYNGSVEAIYTLLSAAAAFSFGFVKVDWKIYGELLLGMCTLLEGTLVLWSSQVKEILFAYLAYILFGVLYHVMITMVSSEVAKHIRSDSYALIFGVNNFMAILIQTVLTMIVNDKNSLLQLATRPQFFVFGSYFAVLGVFFLTKAAMSRLCGRKNSYTSAPSAPPMIMSPS